MSEEIINKSLLRHIQKEVNMDILKVLNDYDLFHGDLKEVQSYLLMSSQYLSKLEYVINETLDYVTNIQSMHEKSNYLDFKYRNEPEKHLLTVAESLIMIHESLVRLKTIEREASQQLYEINQIYDYNLANGLKIGNSARALEVKMESLYQGLLSK